MKKPNLADLEIRESYYHMGSDGTLYYLFLAPGHKKEDFDVSYTGDRITVKRGNSEIGVRMTLRGHKFDLGKAKSWYEDGTLIVGVPPKHRAKGKIEVG